MKKTPNGSGNSIKKFMKEAPVLALTVGVGCLLTVIALVGRGTVYAEQSYDLAKAPLLAVVLQGIEEGRYPWEIWPTLWGEERYAAAASQVGGATAGHGFDGGVAGEGKSTMSPFGDKNDISVNSGNQEDSGSQGEQAFLGNQENSENSGSSGNPGAQGAESGTAPHGEMAEVAVIKPFRASTTEEYRNHISADIYGTAGLERAAEYDFFPVEESYFDDALFIGDSRTVGLRDYTGLSEHADFLCATSLSIYKVLERNIDKKGTVEEVLEAKDYKKIYLSMGINELGRGTTEDFIAQYQTVVNRLRELEPEAIIIIQGILAVSGVRNEKDQIFNNRNITARNHALATLADNRQIFYIDANAAVCDDEGNLEKDYTYDEIHLLGIYNELIQEFLMAHGAEAA